MNLASLPRLLDLEGRFRSSARHNFFANFRTRIQGHRVTFDYYRKIERWLSYVPFASWDSYCMKVGSTCNSFDKFRHWQALHDVFNEAIGAKLLACRYRCSEIEMLHPSDRNRSKTPDWRGWTKSKTTFVEVKTINHSQAERESWYRDTTLNGISSLPAPLKAKIKSSYDEACAQLLSVAAHTDRKIVILVINRDYNLDPIDRDFSDLVLEFLKELERQEFYIFAHPQGP